MMVMMVLAVSKRSILWNWKRILSAGSEEMIQPHKASFEQAYDTHIWVELQRWMSPTLEMKFYWFDVWKANTLNGKDSHMIERDGIYL